MRSLLFVFAVIAAASAAAVATQEKCICQFNHPYGYRSSGGGTQLRTLEKRIEKVAAAVAEIRNYWDTEVSPQRATFKKHTDDLQARVAALEGDVCGSENFNCGGDSQQCVNNLFVCDGDNDCSNGHDEAHCDAQVAAGTVLVAEHINNDECTRRRPNKISVVVTSAKRYGWFKNVAHVTANIVVDFSNDNADQTASLPTTGYYSFAKSELVLLPPEDDRLALTCKFSNVSGNTCEGHIVHEASDKSCASFTMHKQ